MARLLARGLLVIAGFFLTACSAPAQSRPVPAAAPVLPPPVASTPPASVPAVVRAAPTRPAHLWPFTELQGADYVSVGNLAKHYGLKTAWAKMGYQRTLADSNGVRFKFETKERDYYLDGVRVFLGAPVLFHHGDLWVSKLDVIKTIDPLFRPEDHLALLPAAPPKLIVLDAGHGGTDPGKQNLRLKLDEKDMTLDVVFRLKKILELRGYRVILTRDKDMRFSNSPAIDLPWRTEIAKKAGADLFLSIHFNAVDPRDAQRVSGSETYVLTPALMISTQPESDKSMLREKYPGNRQDAANALLGYHLHRQLITALKTSDRGYKRYRYAVLRTLDCPGALLEAAYLSNDTEGARIGTPGFRQQIAEAIAEGVQSYSATLAVLRPAPGPAN
jgi:N-acetylmuramoyl-L-alanine amidase